MPERKATLLAIAKELMSPPFLIMVIALTDAIVITTFFDQFMNRNLSCADLLKHSLQTQLPELEQWCRHTLFNHP